MSRVAGFVTVRRSIEWVAILAGFIAAQLVRRPSGWLGWLELLAAGVLVAAPVVLAAQREYQRQREALLATDLAASYRARLGVRLSDTIVPIADLLGRINAARNDKRDGLQAQLIQGTVDAATALCGATRARVAYLVPEGTVLRPAAWSGRAEPPMLGANDAVQLFDLLARHHGQLVIADTAAWNHLPRIRGDYRSLIVIAVLARGEPAGVLTADAPQPRELDEDDLDMLITLAKLLSAGLSAGRRPALTARELSEFLTGRAPPAGSRHRSRPSHHAK